MPVTVQFATNDGLARADDGDYWPAAGTLLFALGDIEQPIVVDVQGDVKPEVADALAIELSGAVAAVIADARGVVLIANDDGPAGAAGVAITPTEGLFTSEAGGAAELQIVLAAQPAADVTFHLLVTDPTEGELSLPSVTFTATNWDIPQQVTVTGLDDAELDGDQTYRVITSWTASLDRRYHGLNPPDATVTNLDDEALATAETCPDTQLIQAGWALCGDFRLVFRGVRLSGLIGQSGTTIIDLLARLLLARHHLGAIVVPKPPGHGH